MVLEFERLSNNSCAMSALYTAANPLTSPLSYDSMTASHPHMDDPRSAVLLEAEILTEVNNCRPVSAACVSQRFF